MKKKYPIKTDYGVFQAVIWYDKQDNAYLAEPVAFDRAMTYGKSLAEAKRMAKELIELLVESTVDEGNAVVDSNMKVVGKKIKPESILQLQHA
ncbi:type II toxin-antitoxin system HicB family antitoxin [Candidatus Parcubacteria bacterium]|nr:MAG: type II toxin-antitoxin system HicB family antitoxin [Candidatus Parcubacteria bacterium]